MGAGKDHRVPESRSMVEGRGETGERAAVALG